MRVRSCKNGEVIASTSGDSQWPALVAAMTEQGERFLVTGAAPQTALVGASAAVADREGVSVLAVRRMNDKLADKLAERAGVEIRIVDYGSFVPGQGPSRGLEYRRSVARRARRGVRRRR